MYTHARKAANTSAYTHINWNHLTSLGGGFSLCHLACKHSRDIKSTSNTCTDVASWFYVNLRSYFTCFIPENTSRQLSTSLEVELGLDAGFGVNSATDGFKLLALAELWASGTLMSKGLLMRPKGDTSTTAPGLSVEPVVFCLLLAALWWTRIKNKT